MMHRLGVRGRLFIAFFGISAFAVLAAIAAVYSILAIGSVLERTTQHRVPSALGSLEISRKAERIVAAAPALLAATTTAQREELTAEITAEVGRLNELVADLKSDEIDATVLEAIELAVRRLGENLTALDFVVGNHLAARDHKRAILNSLSTTNTGAQRALSPGIRVMDAKFSQLRKVIENPSLSDAERAAASSDLTNTISISLPLQKFQVEVSSINDTLIRAASAATRADLQVLSFPLRKSLKNLQRLLKNLSPAQWKYLKPRFDEFNELATGADGVLEARGKELDLIASGEELILENVDLSGHLTEAVNELLARAKADIAAGNLEAGEVQRVSTLIMMAVVALSLISSTLIVWLYVGRNLIARLTELSDSMLAIAGGNLRAELPAGGGDEIGRMAEALLVFRDTAIEVEESNLAEIEAARRQLTAAIESISEGFSLYDADDRLVLCNSTYRDILYPGLEDIVTPGTTFETIIRRAAELGLIGDAEGRVDEWVAERLERHRNPGGTHLQRRGAEGRWIQVSELRTDDGGTVAVYSDITEMMRHEEELAEKEAQLRVALDNMSGGMRLIDKDLNYVFFNSRYCELYDFPEGLLKIGESIRVENFYEAERGDFGPGDPDALADQSLAELPVQGEAASWERSIAGGKTLQVHVAQTPGGGYVSIVHDITELKEREEKLEEMDRLKTHFLSSVSHELRTPLTSVRGFAKLIHRDFNRWYLPLAVGDDKVNAKGERIVENIGIIQSEGERLTRLINDVLDLSKIEAGSMEWRDATFSANELITHAYNAASGQFADNTAVKVSMAVADGVPDIHADYDRLVQVLVNLLNNAAKFTDEGRIDVTAETASDGWLQISVRDTGPGIPPEDCEKIFDKFHQVTKADVLEDKPKGTGLGLSISLQIVEHYGGRIWVESVLGEGSCFNVTLPPAASLEATATPDAPSVAEGAPDDAQDRPGKAPDATAGGAPLVLVVDDDPAIRNYLMQFMENEGYRVVSAANGRLALEAAHDERPDLITMDLRMPEIDGHAAIRSLRQDGELRRIPIIVISEFALSEESNADAFFTKPIDEEGLLAETRRLLSLATVATNEPPVAAAQEM